MQAMLLNFVAGYIWDKYLKRLVMNKLKVMFRKVKKKLSKNKPSWFELAEKEIGIKEAPGKKDNPRIIEYHMATALKATEDSISWCSAFVCFCMETSGIKSTRNAAARSWLQWGVKLDKPKLGCVVVLWRGSKTDWRGHVGFFIKQDKHNIYILGGNQADEVNISKYAKARLLEYRWHQ